MSYYIKKIVDKRREGTNIAHFETTSSFMVGPLRHELQYVESHEEPRFLFVGCNCSLGALTCHVQWGNLSSFTFCSWFCPLNGAPKFMHAFPGQIPGYFAIRLQQKTVHKGGNKFYTQQKIFLLGLVDKHATLQKISRFSAHFWFNLQS